MAGHELTNNDIKQGQETNQIRKHEVGTHDTHDRGLTHTHTHNHWDSQLKMTYLNKIATVPDFSLLHTQCRYIWKEDTLGFTIHHPEFIMLKKIKIYRD